MLKELVLSLILSAYSASPFLDSPKRVASNFYTGDYLVNFNINDDGITALSFRTPTTYLDLSVITSWGSTQDTVYLSLPFNNTLYLDIDLSSVSSLQEWQDDRGGATITFRCEEPLDENGTGQEGGYSPLLTNYSSDPEYNDDPPYIDFSYSFLCSDIGGATVLNFSSGFQIYNAQQVIYVNPDFNFISCDLEGSPGTVIAGGNMQITVIADDNFGFPDGSAALISGTGFATVSFVSGSEPVENSGLFSKATYLFTNCSPGLTATIAAAYLPAWGLAYQDGYDVGLDGPTNTAYTNGYNNGKSDGYRTGYQDGKKDYQAGGIWSWFESAANVLASFLDIKLFPSFTIGNLIGALVGLTIILFFVRAFLFKS